MPFVDISPWILSLLLAPFGLILGSFGNVLIHRLPQEDPAERNLNKASHCPSCKMRISRWHNLPIFAWLWLRGRCAACGWRIPVRYPVVELLTGLLLTTSPWIFPFGSLIWLKGIICGYALIMLFFTDLTTMILPDVIQFPLMALGVSFTLPQIFYPEALMKVWTSSGDILQVLAFHNGLQPAAAYHHFEPTVTWQQSLAGLIMGYGGPWAFERIYVFVRNAIVANIGGRSIEAGMGMGDFKMLAWLGAFWGCGPMLQILGIGAALGLFLGVPLSIASRAIKLPRVCRTLNAWKKPMQGVYCWWFRAGILNQMLPFGCFLALATLVVVFFGRTLWLGYLGHLVWAG
ncbi:MAG: prepilin peptidase [Acidobacteria bacterium]|nr:prepilin peptidase [Acidobacteriota bacterium]MBI3487959.1 prepilin peptidase [Acidobacteriota bacterium]